MALFSNKQESNYRSSIKMVESVIAELGIPVSETRIGEAEARPGQEHDGWVVMKGSAEIYVFLYRGEQDNFIHVYSPVMTLPERNLLQLFRRLLDLNGVGQMGVAFGLKGEHVVLSIYRSTTDLDTSEVQEMIINVGEHADYYDDILVNEFGGRRYCDVTHR
jgi:hypothetical protein